MSSDESQHGAPKSFAPVGRELRNRRKTLGLSLRDLAPLLGVSRSSLAAYETGTREAPVELVSRWAAVLGMAFRFDLRLEQQPALFPDNETDASGGSRVNYALPPASKVMEAVHRVGSAHLGLATKTDVATVLGMTPQRYSQLFRSTTYDSVLTAAVSLGCFVEVRPDKRVAVWAPDVAPMTVEPVRG